MAAPEYAAGLKFIKLSFPSPHVLHVELARPPVNAISEPFWREYGAVFDRVAADTAVRAVVLSSALPRAFSAGVDLDFLTTIPTAADPARRALRTQPHLRAFQHAIAAPARCPQPVVAALHGSAIGLAIDMVTACDVRYAAEDVKFSIKEVDVGLAADIGTLARLPKLTGNASLAAELALTARAFSAADALALGLVSRVVPGARDAVVAAALALAREIAAKSPVAVVGTKHLLAHARDHTIQDSLDHTVVWASTMNQAPDLEDSARAALRKERIAYPSLGGAPAPKPKL